MAVLIWQGERIKDTFRPVYKGYILKPGYVYTIDIRIANKHFGQGINWFLEKDYFKGTMDSYDATDPYGKSVWWGAGGEQVLVQITNTQAREIDRLWDKLFSVFEAKFPNETITLITTEEGPGITQKRQEEGRGTSWWEKIADFFHTLGIGVAEHETWIKTAVILGGVSASLYFISLIVKKLPGRG